MAEEYEGRVALVTGGAGDLGITICRRFAMAGARVVLADIVTNGMEAQAAELLGSQGHLVLSVDVSDLDSVNSMVNSITNRLGRIDFVVNAAAINRRGTNERLSKNDWQAVIDVNLGGPFNVCQAVIPVLKQQKEGRIINIGSRVWLSGATPNYTASKSGLVGLTLSLARELGPWNITANVVAPSYFESPFTNTGRTESEIAAFTARFAAMTPLGRVATPDDIAGAVLFLASKDAGFITGEVINVSGGAHLAPS